MTNPKKVVIIAIAIFIILVAVVYTRQGGCPYFGTQEQLQAYKAGKNNIGTGPVPNAKIYGANLRGQADQNKPGCK